MNSRASSRCRRIGTVAVTLLAAALLAPGAAHGDTQSTSIEFLSVGSEQGSYSIVSGRLVTTRECRKNRTVKYLLDQEGDGSYRVADAGLSTRNGAFGLLAKLKGGGISTAKIVAAPKRIGPKGDKTLCRGASALID